MMPLLGGYKLIDTKTSNGTIIETLFYTYRNNMCCMLYLKAHDGFKHTGVGFSHMEHHDAKVIATVNAFKSLGVKLNNKEPGIYYLNCEKDVMRSVAEAMGYGHEYVVMVDFGDQW
jgi:hypothetical protein